MSIRRTQHRLHRAEEDEAHANAKEKEEEEEEEEEEEAEEEEEEEEEEEIHRAGMLETSAGKIKLGA